MRLPQQMYDERLVSPMRQELTRLGVQELRTPDEVDQELKNAKGTTLVVVNSVCGCSARMSALARSAAIATSLALGAQLLAQGTTPTATQFDKLHFRSIGPAIMNVPPLMSSAAPLM